MTSPGNDPSQRADDHTTAPDHQLLDPQGSIAEQLAGGRPPALSSSFDADLRNASAAGVSGSAHVTTQHGGLAVGTLIQVKGVVPLNEEQVRPEHLIHVRKTYAKPEGFDQLRSDIESSRHIVVFNLAEARGRSTHAEALAASLGAAATHGPAPYSHLDHAPEQSLGTFDVARLSFGGAEHFPYSRMPQRHKRVWLLEVPGDEEDFAVAETFSECLPALEQMLQQWNSRLFILTRPDQWKRIGGAYPDNWSAPSTFAEVSSLRVAEAQLMGRRPDLDTAPWLADREIRALLDTGTMTEVVGIVRDILKAVDAPAEQLPSLTGSTDNTTAPSDAASLLPRRIRMVVEARKQWRPHLLSWHSKPGRTAFERDFQLTAAVMAGLPVSHIYLASAGLGKVLGGERTVVAGQSAPGVIQLLDAISAELGSDDRVRFARPGWEEAILEYFWVDRPLARLEFVRWLAEVPIFPTKDALEQVTERQRRDVAQRIVHFALRWASRQQRSRPLRELATNWRTDGRERYWSCLIDTLSAVAASQDTDTDPQPLTEHRRYVHTMLLEWARTNDADLVSAVLQVCDGPFAHRYPSKALVRLRNAGRHADVDARTALTSVIGRLWQEPSTRAKLTSAVGAWSADPTHPEVGAAAFAFLAKATVEDSAGELALLVHTDDYRPDLTMISACWQTYLRVTDRSTFDDLVSQWLETAVAHQHQRGTILQILRNAAIGGDGADGRVRERLRVATYDWYDRNPVPERNQLYLDLTTMLDQDLRTEMHSRRMSAEGRNSA